MGVAVAVAGGVTVYVDVEEGVALGVKVGAGGGLCVGVAVAVAGGVTVRVDVEDGVGLGEGVAVRVGVGVGPLPTTANTLAAWVGPAA